MLTQFWSWLKTFVLTEEQAQGLVEYALIILLVAIVVIAALLILGPAIGNIYTNIANALQGYGE
jgi:pilus assembly protein Flp/PilA